MDDPVPCKPERGTDLNLASSRLQHTGHNDSVM